MIAVAKLFAKWAHRKQVRKYTGEPYFAHLEEVANILQTVPHTREMLMAAYLHDTVEDTWVKPWMIRIIFGTQVAVLVESLTDVSRPEDGNRAVRKEIDRKHTAGSSHQAKTVKLADLISNSSSITTHDHKFAKVYMAEKELLLGVLVEGDPTLYARAAKIVAEWKAFKK